MRRSALALAARGLPRAAAPLPWLCARSCVAAAPRGLSSGSGAASAASVGSASPPLLLPPAAAAALAPPHAAPLAASAAEGADAAAAAVAPSLAGPVDAGVAFLEAVHAATGLPWWASIVLATLCARAALAPLALLQARAGAGVAASVAAAARAGAEPPASLRGMASFALAAHAARPAPRPPHPAWILAAPLAQAPVFITALLAVRRLALMPDSPLRTGGAAWCPDLTLPALDWAAGLTPLGAPGLLLPTVAAALLFANVQAAFGAAPPQARQGWPGLLKLGLEWMALPALVAGFTLPHAVMAYWVPSNAWTLAQGAVVRRVVARGAAAAAPVVPIPAGATPQSLLMFAAEARAAGKLGTAAAALAAARAASPGDARAAFAAGEVAAAARDWFRAAEAFSAAAALEAEAAQRGRALFGFGVARAMQMDPATSGALIAGTPEGEAAAAEAMAAFRDAAAARPGDAAPRMALAASLKRAGRLQEARDVAAEAAALDPTAAHAVADLDALIALKARAGTPDADVAVKTR